MGYYAWFKVYPDDCLNDAKLWVLTDAQHRVWFNLLCLAATSKSKRGVIDKLTDEMIAVRVCRGNIELLRESLKVLVDLSIVTVEEALLVASQTQGIIVRRITFVNFEKRQGNVAPEVQDGRSTKRAQSAERARRHRSKKRHRQRLAALKHMTYEEYLLTPEWQERRKPVLERDGYRCVTCNGSENLNVHHRTYDRIGEELPEDLTTLCQTCHKTFHETSDLAQER